MKAIMYHYVRPASSRFPHFRHLHVEDFARQLDHFMQTEGVVSREAFLEALAGGPLPEGVVLTFDDGFIDHYEHVLPQLRKRGLWGIFYIPTDALEHKRILDVHRVHLLLGRHGARKVAALLRDLLAPHMLHQERIQEFEQTTYLYQQNDQAELFVKRVLNYFLKPEYKTQVLDVLMQRLLGEEEEGLHKLVYMNERQLQALHEAGMLIGSHTQSHPVMSTLSAEQQACEIAASFAFLEDLLGPLQPRTFCYPYGGKSTYTEETQQLLTQHGVAFSFAVEPRDITREDVQKRPQALPRYDCNMFPHGQCRV